MEKFKRWWVSLKFRYFFEGALTGLVICLFGIAFVLVTKTVFDKDTAFKIFTYSYTLLMGVLLGMAYSSWLELRVLKARIKALK